MTEKTPGRIAFEAFWHDIDPQELKFEIHDAADRWERAAVAWHAEVERSRSETIESGDVVRFLARPEVPMGIIQQIADGHAWVTDCGWWGLNQLELVAKGVK